MRRLKEHVHSKAVRLYEDRNRVGSGLQSGCGNGVTQCRSQYRRKRKCTSGSKTAKNHTFTTYDGIDSDARGTSLMRHAGRSF